MLFYVKNFNYVFTLEIKVGMENDYSDYLLRIIIMLERFIELILVVHIYES